MWDEEEKKAWELKRGCVQFIKRYCRNLTNRQTTKASQMCTCVSRGGNCCSLKWFCCFSTAISVALRRIRWWHFKLGSCLPLYSAIFRHSLATIQWHLHWCSSCVQKNKNLQAPLTALFIITHGDVDHRFWVIFYSRLLCSNCINNMKFQIKNTPHLCLTSIVLVCRPAVKTGVLRPLSERTLQAHLEIGLILLSVPRHWSRLQTH